MAIPRQGIKFIPALVAAILAVSSISVAQTKVTSTGAEQQVLDLTVYNSNIAIVRDVRRLNIPAGNVELHFADVTAQIEPSTVRVLSLTAPKQLMVLAQDYRYDLLSPQKLLEKYVGKQVTLVRYVKENNSTKEISMKATLLSDNNGPIWQVGNKIITGISADHYVFPALPPNLYSKPTLVWHLDNHYTGEQSLETDYLTKAVNWTTDYVLTLPANAKVADLTSWVTLTNNSGIGFHNAHLQLVAGQVHRTSPVARPVFAKAMLQSAAVAPGIQEEALSEYHLYTIERHVNLPNNDSKQLAFISARDIKVHETFEITGQPSYFYSPYRGGQPGKEPVQAHIKFKNSKANSLGQALPEGIVRVYQADSKNQLQFVGEDRISNTPKNENLNLYVGNAFDVTAERKQTDFQNLGKNVYEDAFQVKIQNHKKESITVEVNEHVGGEWTVLKSNYKYEKTSAFTIQFQVPVPAEGESVLNYRVRIHR